MFVTEIKTHVLKFKTKQTKHKQKNQTQSPQDRILSFVTQSNQK